MYVHHIVDIDCDIDVFYIDDLCEPFIESEEVWLVPGTYEGD